MDGKSKPLTAALAVSSDPDFGVVFQLNYRRIARIIGRIIEDPGRAEELAAEVFWRFSHSPAAQTATPRGWLYRTAVRCGLDELRRQHRRRKYEGLLHFGRSNPTPEQIHEATQRQQQVRQVLSRLKPRDSELLLLRSEGFSYQEIAEILVIRPISIGTLVRRAQAAFRKEYIRCYGEQQNRRHE